jgi:hypothetical protein
MHYELPKRQYGKKIALAAKDTSGLNRQRSFRFCDLPSPRLLA